MTIPKNCNTRRNKKCTEVTIPNKHHQDEAKCQIDVINTSLGYSGADEIFLNFSSFDFLVSSKTCMALSTLKHIVKNKISCILVKTGTAVF